MIDRDRLRKKRDKKITLDKERRMWCSRKPTTEPPKLPEGTWWRGKRHQGEIKEAFED